MKCGVDYEIFVGEDKNKRHPNGWRSLPFFLVRAGKPFSKQAAPVDNRFASKPGSVYFPIKKFSRQLYLMYIL